ncbi:DNA integrity scanning diadenylate cyclase DisA [Candidatus Pacearchaeota archaeon]|nr:DNA integrity scanning diadenylate cyclase DisA [Candidatus Pacearchaeota archaeon]
MEDTNIFKAELSNEINVPKIKIEEVKALSKIDLLKKLSSGTELREGIENIVKGGMGAIIVASSPKVMEIAKGGFKVNCKFNSKRLTELAKMDGAIILSEDFRKILFANVYLVPDSNLTSIETGIRHQVAERTAKQINGLVIAASQRRREITIYYGNSRYVLQHTESLLRRATETLQILEKQRDAFNELIINFNVLEITNLVSVADICRILQRIEIMKKMINIINELIIELGKEGIILRMRMREIVRGIEKEEDFLVKDYRIKLNRIRSFFDNLNFEEILDIDNIGLNLFKDSLDKEISPKGYRILNKTNLPKHDIELLIKNFNSLEGIFASEIEDLERILGVNAHNFKKELNHLREQILVGKRV